MLEGLQEEDSGLFTDRILRCILFVCEGRWPIAEQAIELARHDCRDLIVWAEYDGNFDQHPRDLSVPFAEAG